MAKSLDLAGTLKSVVPKLRRYARVLAGQQELGDSLAAQALATLVAAPDMVPSNLRLEAYAELTRLYHLYSASYGGGRVLQTGPERHLAALTSEARQAFLLVAMEEFSTGEAAQILGIPQTEFEVHLQTGRRMLAAEIACDVLIIEDELFIATDIERAVVSLGHRVISVERTHKAAREAAMKLRPSLILADVKLADDSSGIDAVNDILEHYEVPVIFITAYPERLLTGLRPEPTYLLTKPFTQDSLRAIIAQALLLDVRARRVATERKASNA